MSAYSNYLQSLNSMNQADVAVANLNEMKAEVYESRLREQYEKWGDLALTLHGSSGLMRGLNGLYGGFKKKVRETANKIANVEDATTKDSVLKPFVKSTDVELKDLGSRSQIETSGKIPQFDIASADADIPEVSTFSDIGFLSKFRSGVGRLATRVRGAISRPAGVVEAPEVTEAPEVSTWMEGLSGRLAAARVSQPSLFEPQFEGGVAPRGFGQRPPEIKRGLRSWDQDDITSVSKAQVSRPADIDPAVIRGHETLTSGEIEQAEMKAAAQKSSIRMGKEAVADVEGDIIRPTEEYGEQGGYRFAGIRGGRTLESFSGEVRDAGLSSDEIRVGYKAPTQGEAEYGRKMNTPEARQYASKKGLPQLDEEADGMTGPVTEVTTAPVKTLEARFGGRVEVAGERLGGQRGESILARVGKRKITEPTSAFEREYGKVRQEEPVKTEQAPEPVVERPPSPSSEITPVRAKPQVTPREVDEPEIAPTKAIVAPEVEDVTAEIGLSDAIPVVGEIAALGFGIYDLAEMFKHHAPPAIRAGLSTGIAPPSVEGGAGSGYV